MANRVPSLAMVDVQVTSGTGMFACNLARGLRAHADRVRVELVMLRDTRLSLEQQAAFSAVHCVGSRVSKGWQRIYETPRDAVRLRALLKTLSPDLVLSVGTYSNLICSLAWHPDRLIMTEHMNMSLRLQEAPFAGVMRRLMRWRYPRGHFAVASEGIARDLRTNFGVQDVTVIPNGLDLAQVQQRSAEASPVPVPQYPYYVAVGRLTPQKDYPTLIRAHDLACQAGIPHHLVILGDGELRADLEQLAGRMASGDRIHFLGQCSNPFPIMKHARCLVLTSVFEGFAYVPVEAMALGTPVLVTDCPSGPADIVQGGRSGILVPPSSPVAVADAIVRICRDDTLHAELARKGLLRARELSVENMADHYYRLANQMMARGRREGESR